MTGIIKILNFVTESGLIEGENGLRFPFEPSAVLAYDAAHLCVGQMVAFEFENGKALNISIQKKPRSSAEEGSRKGGVFRYMGFDQANAVRTFRFERTFVGEAAELFTVSMDLALFAKYHITLQEGPGLCSRLLTLELDVAGVPVFERALTERDILAHVASRPGAAARHHKRPAPPRPV